MNKSTENGQAAILAVAAGSAIRVRSVVLGEFDAVLNQIVEHPQRPGVEIAVFFREPQHTAGWCYPTEIISSPNNAYEPRDL